VAVVKLKEKVEVNGFEFNISFDYSIAEDETDNYPGIEEIAEVYEAFHCGEDILELLQYSVISDLETKAKQSIPEKTKLILMTAEVQTRHNLKEFKRMRHEYKNQKIIA
jgi:hypothetical protein